MAGNKNRYEHERTHQQGPRQRAETVVLTTLMHPQPRARGPWRGCDIHVAVIIELVGGRYFALREGYVDAADGVMLPWTRFDREDILMKQEVLEAAVGWMDRYEAQQQKQGETPAPVSEVRTDPEPELEAVHAQA